MADSKKAKGLILKCVLYSESDLIIQFLSNHGEKLSLIARGAVKSKKRFAGGILQPSHYVEIRYRPSRQGGEDRLATLEEAVLLDGFEKVRSDYDRLEVCFYILEILLKTSQEGDSLSADLFHLAGHSLRALESAKNLKKIKMHFILKILFQQGVLEPEKWMELYLKTPMAQHLEVIQNSEVTNKTSSEASWSDAHLFWAENKLKEYLPHR